MTTEFTSLNLRDELMQAITELGYSTPTPIQAGMIPLMLTGADVVGIAVTKTRSELASAGYKHGLWVPRPIDALLPDVWATA